MEGTNMSEWMENELRRQMRPVVAPEQLWARIQAGNRPKPTAKQPVRPLWFMPVFAAALVLLTAGLLSGIRQSRLHMRDIAPLTDQELRVLADSSSGETYP